VRGVLAQELQQIRPFDSLEEEALLNLSRTFEVWHQASTQFLRPFGLSPTQYNVLRILRGAGDLGATCSEVAERMVNHDPDITRLMDRLERLGWIERRRGEQDRRVVIARLTPAGSELLSRIDEPLRAFLRDAASAVGDERLVTLIALLEDLRELILNKTKSDCNPPHLTR
jgi:DNA-binding MarR family transcriptional regulator